MALDHSLELPEVEAPEVTSSRLARVVYALLGFVCLGLGIAGYIVPVLPGTVFLLMATWFFFKSSPRMYHWVLDHPRFGPTVRAYRAGYGIRRRIKIIAVSLMLVSVTISIVFAVDSPAIRVMLAALAAYGAWFILSRPTTEDVVARLGS